MAAQASHCRHRVSYAREVLPVPPPQGPTVKAGRNVGRWRRLNGGPPREGRRCARRSCQLLFDEPTAHLDRATGRAVIKTLRSAARDDSLTVIAASHDPDLLAAADTMLSLDDARPLTARGVSPLAGSAR